ncbi:MAG TPA: trypsin-like peptidase domain-containing protein, partial [Flavobacteriaceae bacterium]|nr:trypsin-like peptidase domain-containing protein [Flavobacteriaceae bacterium]
MKKAASFLMVSILGGIIALGSYKLFIENEKNQDSPIFAEQKTEPSANFVRTGFNAFSSENLTNFTEAANKTVHAVVHVKNMSVARQPRNMYEYLHGGGIKKEFLRGTGSGVIITPDGYIVTNNHVIKGASAIQVTLNNNKTYTAEVVGADAETDIALLKIDAENLHYIPFGNSNNVEIGQWVLAVGNPFNLTSTVTAGIISAKARDLNRNDKTFQSFIQTDAAINSGNSGGALVNTQGQLIGINTAITSRTGSYIGYSFAIPSNTVRKIVEDILEYGDVREAILGVRGTVMNGSLAKNFDLGVTQGFYIAGIDAESGAKKAGLKKGDVILKIDNIRITKFADLTGYLNTKHPNETVT